jgi:uncharacterized membrane protein (DUF485 family)
MKFNINALAWAGAWFGVILYIICVLWIPAFGNTINLTWMKTMMSGMWPGFVWIGWGSFIWGLILSFIYGWLAGWVFGSIYNKFAKEPKAARKRRR